MVCAVASGPMTVEHKPATKPVEIDATTLSYEEWFFLWAAFGQKPEAKLTDIAEWRRRSVGMTPQQKQMTFHMGLDSMIQRGAIRLIPTTKSEQPEYEGNFRIVSRIREAQSVVPKLH